ncbi:hypothetical protein BH09BAC2_BH09BAC2_23580 [soil metagenome]
MPLRIFSGILIGDWIYWTKNLKTNNFKNIAQQRKKKPLFYKKSGFRK